MSGSLDRSRIMKLFGELSEELERQGLRGHVYLVGGAALVAGYGRKRSTRDVDARIVYEKQGVTEAARRLAEKYDLPANWLIENATLFIPHKEDSQAATVFNSPGLVVTGASARHLLAMKIDAGRPEDIDDIRWLLEQLRIDDIDEALAIHRETYPHSALRSTSRSRLEEAFKQQRRESGRRGNVALPPPPRPATAAMNATDPERKPPRGR